MSKSKINVAVHGACGTTGFAWIAHMLMWELQDHPYFNLTALVAERTEDEGKTFRDAVREWYEDRTLTPAIQDLKMLPADGRVLRDEAGVQLVLSCSPPAFGKKVDMQLAETGMPVVSESPGLRDVSDIPLVVPEINSDHLSILEAQKRHYGWDTGFIVSNPVCTITVLALSLKPIIDAFGVEKVIVTTLQAVSGAGRTGVASMAIIDNLIPYIGKEEEKLYHEGRKIFGSLKGEEIVPAEFQISSTCTRVPVLHGHTGSMFVQCKRPVTVDEVAEAMRNFKGLPENVELPSAPSQPIYVTDVIDRPQPRLDREAGNGKSVTVGRIRLDEALPNGIKYVVVGHNMLRGTAGNTLLNAELLVSKGLVG